MCKDVFVIGVGFVGIVVVWELYKWGMNVSVLDVCEGLVLEISFVNVGVLILFEFELWNVLGVYWDLIKLLFDLYVVMKLCFVFLFGLISWGLCFLCNFMYKCYLVVLKVNFVLL